MHSYGYDSKTVWCYMHDFNLPSVDIQIKEVSESHCTTEILMDSCTSVEHA